MLFEMFFKHEHSWSFLLNKVILFHQKKKKKKKSIRRLEMWMSVRMEEFFSEKLKLTPLFLVCSCCAS